MNSEKFCKNERIVRKEDFQRLFQTGRRKNMGAFNLYFIAGETEKRRIGIIASRKVGNAVVRNRGKRFFRDIFRKNKSLLPTGDILVRLSPSFREMGYQEIKGGFLNELASLSSLKRG